MSDDNYFQEELDENIDDDEGYDGDEQIESVPTHSFGLRSGRAAEASSSNTNGSFDYSSGREDSPTGMCIRTTTTTAIAIVFQFI